MLKTTIVALVVLGALVVAGSSSEAATRVRGSVRSSGTYVAPHYRSRSDGRRVNNYSTRGNTNPFTGKSGTRSPVGQNGRGF